MTPAVTSILLTPARIGGVEIKNRIIMPPMTTRLSDDEGRATDDTIAYYMARVRGGVGMITVEMASPERAGRHRRRELGIYDDRFLPGLTRLAAAIHGGGAKASIQLGHGGGHTRRDICGETPVAPSAIPHPVYEVTNETIVPEAMTRERIAEAVAAFARAGARAKAAGFDCVEIHAAHGYLISQFATPFENRRTDEYGGSLENRARFGLEVLRAVKAAVGTMPVIYRVSVDDYFPQGLGVEDGVQIAVWAAEAGADALHIAAGHYRSRPSGERMIPPMAYPDATFLAYAAAVKQRVGVPVIAVGRLGDPERATEAVASGKADFVALGRTLIADPDWVTKLERGEPARRCLACNTCVNEMRGGAQLHCVVNGAAGQERRFESARPPVNERIAVIGAGPAGLTYASLVARGNAVTVFERAAGAGGSFRYAGKAPLFQDVVANQESFDRYIGQLEAACAGKGVVFRYGVDVTLWPELLKPFDRIVIATGAAYRFGLGPAATALLDRGAGRWPVVKQVLSSATVRDWFYHRGRTPTGPSLQELAHPGQTVVVIGDARAAGKSRPAISSAFEAALRA
ncbi:MAG TPA: NAD(P)-binding protein [Xanthobacteraceae bacterium]|nr:NAD(P)-binding protein [Xanthobacteraceae bacterium]